VREKMKNGRFGDQRRKKLVRSQSLKKVELFGIYNEENVGYLR
jgi:hypothetical protein